MQPSRKKPSMENVKISSQGRETRGDKHSQHCDGLSGDNEKHPGAVDARFQRRLL